MWCSRSPLRRKRSSKSILRVIVENFYRLVALGPVGWVATSAVRISASGSSRGGNSWDSAAPPSLINLETARGLAATITGAFRTGDGADAGGRRRRVRMAQAPSMGCTSRSNLRDIHASRTERIIIRLAHSLAIVALRRCHRSVNPDSLLGPEGPVLTSQIAKAERELLEEAPAASPPFLSLKRREVSLRRL